MSLGKNKTYKVDFFVATHNRNREHTHIVDFLKAAGTHTEAIHLDSDTEEKYQIKSMIHSNGSKVIRGVFGRCRFGEKPIQGDADGKEAEVDLKPGHGLVEKNHFVYYAERNLFIYQRNPTGSHHSRLQRYFSAALGKQILMEPILTRDSYQRLMEPGVQAKCIELSFQQPRDPSVYGDMWIGEAMKLVNSLGGLTAKIRIGVGREHKTLIGKAQHAAVSLARAGIARVARVTIEEEAQPIDLIADRIIESINVPLDGNGRPTAEMLYAELASAESRREQDLKAFFGE